MLARTRKSTAETLDAIAERLTNYRDEPERKYLQELNASICRQNHWLERLAILSGDHPHFSRLVSQICDHVGKEMEYRRQHSKNQPGTSLFREL